LHADKSVDGALVVHVHERRKLRVIPGILEEHALEIRRELGGVMVAVVQE
jgi:hypothetical protein